MPSKASHLFILCALSSSLAFAADPSAEPRRTEVGTALDTMVTVEMVGPVTKVSDLQIICLLKHDPAGDKYLGAMQALNEKLGGLLSSLRERGEFAGELGETMLFTPLPNTIAPAKVLLIGVGSEKELSKEKLFQVGKIAARESVRLKAATVAWAPMLRDQGSERIDVGEGDGAFAQGFFQGYFTELQLQKQKLSPTHTISRLTIEAGPSYFEQASTKVRESLGALSSELTSRATVPYTRWK